MILLPRIPDGEYVNGQVQPIKWMGWEPDKKYIWGKTRGGRFILGRIRFTRDKKFEFYDLRIVNAKR